MGAAEFKVSQALKSTGETSELTDREKHLIGLAVVLTRGCQLCTGRRMEDAIKSGMTYDTVRETIDLSAAVNAGVVLRSAISGVDLANLDAACSGEECSVGNGYELILKRCDAFLENDIPVLGGFTRHDHCEGGSGSIIKGESFNTLWRARIRPGFPDGA